MCHFQEKRQEYSLYTRFILFINILICLNFTLISKLCSKFFKIISLYYFKFVPILMKFRILHTLSSLTTHPAAHTHTPQGLTLSLSSAHSISTTDSCSSLTSYTQAAALSSQQTAYQPPAIHRVHDNPTKTILQLHSSQANDHHTRFLSFFLFLLIQINF